MANVTQDDVLDNSSEYESELDSNDEHELDKDPAGIAPLLFDACKSTTDSATGMTSSFDQASIIASNVPSDLSQNPECAPCQPELKPFPKQRIGKLYRSFHSSLYESYRWLEYSEEKDSSFCFHCRHFSKHDSDSTFVIKGFRNWKKCYGSDPKHNKLLKHQLSSAHVDAVAAHNAFLARKRNDTRYSVLGMISDAHSQMVHANRHCLKTLCEILCLTAERHISQRERVRNLDRRMSI